MSEIQLSDYSLVGKRSIEAIEQGLAEATWYTSPVPKRQMRELLQRRDGPARDCAIWFGLLIVSGAVGYHLWPSWWAILPFLVYGVIYGSTSDSRWHESGHGTAFKTDWLNNALYEVASFMVMRESTIWRWSHTRHHSDTIIVGRDPEIAVPRPPDLRAIALGFINVEGFPKYFRNVVRHAFLGRLTDEERTFVPDFEHAKVFARARVYLLIYVAAIALAIYTRSVLPLMYVGLPNLYGAWLGGIYAYPQHAGLAENVLDHRLNCRTVYMSAVNRFLYWNMNYHLEHHMFPLVPYHNLPRLHELVKADCPTPYPSLWAAWREIVPAVLRQVKDPAYHIKRELPTPTDRREANGVADAIVGTGRPMIDGWVDVCAATELGHEDVIRFDRDQGTFAVYRLKDGTFYATDGICTHGNTHLADGFVRGDQIDCPKHNGRFNILDGSPRRAPVCVALRTYPIREMNGRLLLNLKPSNANVTGATKTYALRVVSNENVATYIKELVLEPADADQAITYQPGDYVQLDIPAYGEIRFDEIDVREPFASVWRQQHVFDFKSVNAVPAKRNYSFATNPSLDERYHFNVRIATPPRGQACHAGSGSAYVHRLKVGDIVTATGPFGSFRIRPTLNEMIYIGAGSGMAPLRSHLSYLFDKLRTTRRVSFWYGARSLQEVFYRDYFERLAREFANFSYHLVLSEAAEADQWQGLTGHAHDAEREYLDGHLNPGAVEYYLCGPPVMIQSAREMLRDFKVSPDQLSYDEF